MPKTRIHFRPYGPNVRGDIMEVDKEEVQLTEVGVRVQTTDMDGKSRKYFIPYTSIKMVVEDDK